MVRNTAKTIIECNNKILCIKKKLDKVGVYYTLPGGGQEPGETIEETALRECKEELNINAKIEELVCVREYISNNHEYSFLVKQAHAIEFIFRCSFDSQDKIINLQNDIAQIGFEWLEISSVIENLKHSEIKDIKFPLTLKNFLKDYYISCNVKPYSTYKF